MSKRSIKMTESRNGMTVAQFYDKVSEVKDYLSNDTPLFAKFGDSTWCINSAYASRKELILTDGQGFTCDLARLYELKKSNELGQKKAVYFIADGGGGLFRIDSVRIKSDARGSNKTLVLELLKDFSFESEDPVDDDVGTVDVHYIYSDGDVDDDTGYIVQWEDYYEVQSDLHCAQGKTLEELKANFETEVMSNLDYDVEDAEFEWNIEEDLEESKKKINEAIVDYIHPRLKIEAEYVPTVYYACYTLDNEGNEVDHFDNFNYFEDAVSACRQKTDDTHQATHACVVIEDEQDDEALEFKRSNRLSSNYEVVVEFSPDAGEALTEADITRSFEFHGNGHTDYEGEGFDAYYSGVSYFDCPIKHPEWAYYKWKEGWKKAEKQDMFSKRKSESCFKKNRITEDSLDDFDVDGKIAAANKVAMSDEKLQSAIKSIKEQYSDYLYEAVGRLFSSYDLQEVNKEFLKPGEFKCFVSSNMFGGSSRVGSTFYVVFEIGDRYRGALPEHVKLDYSEKRAAVQQFAKELQDEINEIIDEAKAKGFAVHRLQGYGDVFVRDVSQMGSECIEIKISCKITQEEVNSLMESVKTKSKKISEAKIQESAEDPLSSRTFRLSPEQVERFETLGIIKEKFDDRCCCIEDVRDQSRYTEGMAELMDFYVQGTGIPEIEAIYWEIPTGNYFTWKIEVNLLDEDGEGLYEDILSFIEDSIEGTSMNESRRIKEASISKVKKFGTPYLEKIAAKAQGIADAIEKENNYKLELCGPEYDAYQTASTVVGTAAYYLNTNHDWRANKKFFRRQLYQLFEDPVEFFGLDYKNGHDGFGDEFFQACHEDGIMPYMRKYIKESDILEALDFVEKEVYQNKINTGKEKELLGKSIERDRKDKEEREARYAAQAAKFAKDTKFLQDAAKTAKVVIDEIEGYSRPDDWSVILDTEDDYKANAFRNAVGDLLEGTENAYGASYDDIPGMGSIHLGCIQYYEWSEMNGGDIYDDLDESIREKYVVFACPKKKWIDYRRRTDW